MIRFVGDVAFMSRKSKSKTVAGPRVAGSAQRLRLFGPPLLIVDEDPAAHDQLLARMHGAVKPVDIIEEILVDDLVALEWQVLRWRRLESTLLRVCGLDAVQDFLAEHLDYDVCQETFTDHLAEILRDELPEEEANAAHTLARECARNDVGAVERVNEVLGRLGLRMDQVLSHARADTAKAMVQEYAQRKPGAIKLVKDVLARAGMGIDRLMSDALADKLDDIERINRLSAAAESRRNATLNELDRRRATLGEASRRSVQEIEDAQFEVIEPREGKDAA